MTIPAPTRDKIRETISDPVLFTRKWLKSDIWSMQEDILRSVERNPRTAVKACHASAKTYTAARAVLWFLARWKESIVVTTAPTWSQVEKLLWGEIHSALGNSLYPFPKPTATELKLGPKRYALGLSTSVTQQNEGVRFQGFHADHILMVLDEAPGVDPKIWEAIEGARAGGDVRILALGNPTVPSGPFYDAFAGNNNWSLFTIGAFATPNLAGLTLEDLLALSEEDLDRNPRPYLTTRRWVKEKYYEWGPGHPLWESRVLGQFPTQSEDSLISLAWLEAAARREPPAGPLIERSVTAGVDVAGPGEDETVLTIQRAGQIIKMQGWSHAEPRGEVIAALQPYRDVLAAVNVDSAGIGYYFAKHLKDVGFRVNLINVGEAPNDTEKFVNLKAEHYWGLRMRFESGAVFGDLGQKAVAQLASIRYKHNARGQIVIESKDEMRKRGVKSPDHAESVMLAFAKGKPAPRISFLS